MSISAFQESFVKGGCGKAVILTCAGIFFVGMFYNCGRSSAYNNGPKPGEGPLPAVTVGGIPVPADMIEKLASDLTTQETQSHITPDGSIPPPTLALQVGVSAQAVQTAVEQAATIALASKNGVKFTQAEVDPLIEKELAQEAETLKQQFIAAKKIPATATAQDLDAELVKEQKPTIADSIKGAKEKIAEKLKKKDYASLAAPLLMAKLTAANQVSDAEFKSAFQTYDVKRILVKDAGADSAAVRAQRAAAEIKGGQSFEKVAEKYTADPATKPGKKPGDAIMHIPGRMATPKSGFAVIVGKPVGTITDPTVGSEGICIFKIVAIKDETPKDFAAKSAQYREVLGRQKASQELRTQMDDLMKSSLVKWTSPGYHALYDYTQAALNPADSAKMRAVVDEAKAAITNNKGYDARAASFARYAAFSALYSAAGPKKDTLRDERIEVLIQVLESAEDVATRLELVDLYESKKDAANAVIQLVAAAKANSATFDISGEKNYRDIAGKSAELVSKGLVKDVDVKDVQTALASWKDGKADSDKRAADAKKQQADALKSQKELERQNEELVKKQKEEAEKAAKKPGK